MKKRSYWYGCFSAPLRLSRNEQGQLLKWVVTSLFGGSIGIWFPILLMITFKSGLSRIESFLFQGNLFLFCIVLIFERLASNWNNTDDGTTSKDIVTTVNVISFLFAIVCVGFISVTIIGGYVAPIWIQIITFIFVLAVWLYMLAIRINIDWANSVDGYTLEEDRKKRDYFASSSKQQTDDGVKL